MKLEQIYTGCLAEAAYYIESKGEVMIIDPLRESKPYLERAERDGAKIKYIFESHFHADFVSGHIDLARKTGATIIYGPTATAGYDIHVATDGEIFNVGDISFKLLHTPGHTMESSCLLMTDENGKETALFSGDTLFIGDVGRPDLAIKAGAITVEDLAGFSFDSLRNKIMPLADDIIVYPNHGAGSACGKNMSSETFATLGNQKEFNYALRADMTRDEFIAEVTDGLTAPPQYFPKNAMKNKMGYESFDLALEKGCVARSIEDFEGLANTEGALILDTRSKDDFAAGFIPNSIFIGIDGGFAPWVGALVLDLTQPILIVADAGKEEEVVTRLARVGYDNALGYLEGGFAAWKTAGKETDSVENVTPEELVTKVAEGKVLDVRQTGEYISEHADGAINMPLTNINDMMDKLDKDTKYFVHCASGYRSIIAASILQSRGIRNIANITDGFKGMKNTSLECTDYVCPSTIL